jgi:imidazoleglycerol-phosphate dehydratase / histidinol-phosphatase
MKKALFIDRDGTLIREAPDEQVDTLEKLEFMPKVFRNLYRIRQNTDLELVIVSNQDGLGTEVYPEKDYNLVQSKMLKAFENEGITFDDILIDKTFPHENALTRKPNTGLLKKYMKGDYDLANSFVIGDRLSDIQLAKNIGAKGILIGSGFGIPGSGLTQNSELKTVCVLVTEDWDKIYEFLMLGKRLVIVERKTKETEIRVELNLDGTGKAEIQTGISFFDHMLEQISRHSGCDLRIKAKGDIHIDEHHTIEDAAITLGEAIYKALGDKRGIERYGYCLPMDDSLAQVALDFGGRSWIEWNAEFKREKIGDMPTEMFFHFFKSLSDSSKSNIHIKAEGDNEHHKIEAIFKAFAKSLKMAIKQDLSNMTLPSTKGLI